MELYLGILLYCLYLIIMVKMLEGIGRWFQHLRETTDLFENNN